MMHPAKLAPLLLAADLAPADPAWQPLLAHACPDTRQTITGGVRDLCQLDRFGLLDPGAVYTDDDLRVFVLYDWLLVARVDPELAARVARPLLTASTYATWGLDPPRANSDLPPYRALLEIRISAAAVSVDGVAVLALADGRPSPGSFVSHVSQDLRKAVVDANARAHGDVTLQTFTSLVDTVTGEDCELTAAQRDTRAPEDCRFWRAILDFDPPIRVDPLARFGAGVEGVEVVDGPPP